MSRLLWARLIILKDSIVIDDIDVNRIDINDHDLSLLKKHKESKKVTLQSVFKVSSELELYYNRALQDRKNTASSNQSSEIDDSQDEYRTWIFNSKENNVWHFADNSFVMQNDDIKTDDENTSAEIESNLSEINTADTQLNISCSTKESKHIIAWILMQLSSLLIVYALSASVHLRIKKEKLFTQMITMRERQQSSISSALSSSDSLLSSNLRVKMIEQRLRSRSEKL